MGIIYNTNWRRWKDGKKQTVPAPVDPDSPNEPWLYDRIARDVPSYGLAGHSAVQFPPSCKTQGGCANDADGYGKQCDYDLGEIMQSYSVPTRFGRIRQLRRAIANTHACGLQAYGDQVFHQYDGSWTYPCANAATGGRFEKTATCFSPPQPVDNVFDSNGNFAFGNRSTFEHSSPPDYMASGMIDATDWQTVTAGFDGYRLDDTKGTSSAFLNRLMNAKSMQGKYFYGECFTSNSGELAAWVAGTNGRAGTICFGTHFTLQHVCDQGAYAGMLLDPNNVFCLLDPAHGVSYVESPDTDVSPGQQIVGNKALAYWYMLTSVGYPTIYARDYMSEAWCYGLGPLIDNLNWIHENLALGAFVPRYGSQSVACFERTGYPGLLSAGNWNPYNQTITVPTNFGSYVELQDYAGHIKNVWTNRYGQVTFTIPGNYFGGGESFVCLSRKGYNQPFALHREYTDQILYGAVDLPVGPAQSGKTIQLGEIWCDSGFDLELRPVLNADLMHVTVLDPDGKLFPLENWHGTTEKRGYHKIMVDYSGTTPKPIGIEVHYMGTQGLTDAEWEAELPKNQPTSRIYSIPDSVAERSQAFLNARLIKRGLIPGTIEEALGPDYATKLEAAEHPSDGN